MMLPTLKAEFRKLLTVRSTYIITGLVVVLVIFIAFYIEGWRLASSELQSPNLLTNDVLGGLNVTIFGAIVAILLMTHEYRYSTIMYTLTASKNRSQVLLSKLIVISLYAGFLAIIVAVLSPIMSYLGLHAHGYILVHQTLDVWSLVWKSLFYGWAYGLAGLIIAVIARNQVASIAALFLIPGLGEELLSLLFKGNSSYLPFTALDQVINPARPGDVSLTPDKAALVFVAYLVVGGIISWLLFLRRDAI